MSRLSYLISQERHQHIGGDHRVVPVACLLLFLSLVRLAWLLLLLLILQVLLSLVNAALWLLTRVRRQP
jgi:hypothetical protein